MSKNHSKRYAENQKFLELKTASPDSSEAEPVHSRIKSTATSAARPAISRCVCRKEKATSRSAARNAEQNSSKHLIKGAVRFMFGYVTIRKDDLKVKDYNKYQAYYCGLCQDIKEAYGKRVRRC